MVDRGETHGIESPNPPSGSDATEPDTDGTGPSETGSARSESAVHAALDGPWTDRDGWEIDVVEERSSEERSSEEAGHARLDLERLVRVARLVLAAEGVAGSVSLDVTLVDDERMRQINNRHLGHDYPTDVITFPLSEPNEPIVAQIVLGAEFAETAAAESGLSVADECALYLVHGILHLCGYDDRSEADRRAMTARQDELLSLVREAC